MLGVSQMSVVSTSGQCLVAPPQQWTVFSTRQTITANTADCSTVNTDTETDNVAAHRVGEHTVTHTATVLGCKILFSLGQTTVPWS